MKKPTILVLGGNGMVGTVISTYLSQKNKFVVYKTTRKKTNSSYKLTTLSAKNDLEYIYKHVGDIDVIINCIAEIKKTADKQTLIITNSLFPHILEDVTQKYSTKLIHISTDAVFGKTQGQVTEKVTPIPDSYYGMSKLLGETEAIHALTIRTSFIGFSDRNPISIPSWITHTNEKHVKGYINQMWTGCTTLQFAKLCEEIIQKNLFKIVRSHSPFLHFAPIRPTTKYEIVKTTVALSQKKITVQKTNGEHITRFLATCYPNSVSLPSYSQTIHEALTDLYAYTKT